jgi:glucokinase
VHSSRQRLARTGDYATAACFDVGGPVIDGHAHPTNLLWDLDEAALRTSLNLQRVTLLNDLKAIAYAVPSLAAGAAATINACRPKTTSAMAFVVRPPLVGLSSLRTESL